MGATAAPVMFLACHIFRIGILQRTDWGDCFSFFHQQRGDLPRIALRLTAAPDSYAYSCYTCFPLRRISSLGDARRRGTKVQGGLAAPPEHCRKTCVVETLSAT